MGSILITGVAGFIGSKVADRFLREGYSVVGIDDLSSGRLENVPRGVNFIRGDLARASDIDNLPPRCQLILHLAGQSSGEISFDDPVADLSKNVVSTLNLIKYGLTNDSERIIFASSMSVYGSVSNSPVPESHPCSPLSCYGVGKLSAEGYLKVYGSQLPYVCLRMFNVYGPGQDLTNLRQGMVSIYLAQALSDRHIKVKGSVQRFRDFIFIDDVVEAWYRAASSSSALGRTLNVGTGLRTTVGELLAKIRDLVPGSEYSVVGATPGDQNGIFADTSLLRSCLAIESFTSLETGLQIFADWAKHKRS